MRCTRQITLDDALREVYRLRNLRHAHIIQSAGSYVQGRYFAILMYPIADCHLGTFLEDTGDLVPSDDHRKARVPFLTRSISCLTSAIVYVHEHTTRHMDIEPQNILVKEKLPHNNHTVQDWIVYLTDFGLPQSFASQDHSQNDGPTLRTPKYCAPEVFRYERRGQSVDILSLGCVFSETLTICCDRQLQ